MLNTVCSGRDWTTNRGPRPHSVGQLSSDTICWCWTLGPYPVVTSLKSSSSIFI